MFHTILIATSVAALAGFALGTAYGSRRARAGHTPPQRPRYTCTCGQHFYDEQQAKEHARDTHNAPMQDDEWRTIMDVAGQPDA